MPEPPARTIESALHAADPPGLAAWGARLAAARVAVESEVAWPNGARSVCVRDPAGNSVEFAEARAWHPPAGPAAT